MARNIAADNAEAFRAVLVWKTEDGTLEYDYEGLYEKYGTAMGRCTYYANVQDYRDQHDIPAKRRLYDAWVEKADISWNKVKD